MKKLLYHGYYFKKLSVMLHLTAVLVTGTLFLLSSGCAPINVGYDFPDEQVINIRIGQTTKDEIRAVFGEPWRTGLENGRETWTYGKYSYRGTKETDAKDLVVRFTDKNIVESYTFSKTNR
ncbi:MAG: outer membrane protein assembly factor BamE [Deltaproteobacteria bacterium]|jgi:outer membrane protein assembly factor BamE (lipoprotein component of BamABCDE complex)|nr:outer membrane protein assembly factor BamE [Deltaproteobacteria bacterium]